VTPRVVILGAGRPNHGESHSALRTVDRRGNVLDWLLGSLDALSADIRFVGGYDFTDVVERFPTLHHVLNPIWQDSGALRSLLEAGLEVSVDTYVSYADILFRPELVAQLAALPENQIGIAVDSSRRVPRRTTREVVVIDGEGRSRRFTTLSEAPEAALDLVGLVKVPAALVPNAEAALRRALEKSPIGHLTAWLEELRGEGAPLTLCDVRGQWTDLDSEATISRFVFGTKAETLARLSSVLTGARIAPQVTFSVQDWQDQQAGVIERVLSILPAGPLAVRSSALSEDSFDESNAGRFRSELNVDFLAGPIADAIEKVVGSYDGDLGHQVLVQPMIRDVALSGVAFTRTLGSGAPYRVINYAEGSQTDIVTSGGQGASKVVYVHRDYRLLPKSVNGAMADILAALDEVERLTELDTLDVEFAVDAAGVCHILQVRPLLIDVERVDEQDARIGEEIAHAVRIFDEAQTPLPGIVGQRTIFGVMPDWNPAEIVGVAPDRLADSLYRNLITDETWAVQRFEFGYRDLRHQPLIRLFAGHPYVDVRASVNSFIPASVPDTVATRLVDYSISYLDSHPELHDKLEFAVVLTCLDLDFSSWDARFADAGLSALEIASYRDDLRSITEHAFSRCESALDELKNYAAFQDRLLASGASRLSRAAAMLQHCRRSGTLIFAHLARCGFVAMSLLRSAVRTGVVTQDRANDFLGSIRTVGHRLPADALAVGHGTLEWDEFVSRYSHLRPGTYDVRSPSYGANAERYLRPLVNNSRAAHDSVFYWTLEEEKAWQKAMNSAGLVRDIREIDRFLRRAIEGREEAKFVFTRAVSAALDEFADWGRDLNLDLDTVANLDVADILAASSGALGPERHQFQARAAQNRERMAFARGMRLPPLLRDRNDFISFQVSQVEPNFVTSNRVEANVTPLHDVVDASALAGKIVLIDNADPGYDWLFGCKVAGLITSYGGANSHMAIRAAEFALPAAIGVGTSTMEALRQAELVELDCAARRILVVR
jgi:choline kinase/phosphohistidine swiveling domain-containing protein